MKKIIIITFILVIILSFLCIIKQNNKNKVKILNNNNYNPYELFNFYKSNNLERYKNYKIKYPELKTRDIVLRVNIGLDNGYYTNTEEVLEFNTLMLVNKYHYVSDTFTPINLVPVEEYSKPNMFLNEECKNAFIKMAREADVNGYKLRAISTYRTLEYQNNLYNNYVKKDGVENADTYSAHPGYSEHHTGLAIDIDNESLSYNNFENTREFTWMMENAHKYGFILRYPKDSTITGYIYEPWHYRYVGINVATYIKKHNMTFEE